MNTVNDPKPNNMKVLDIKPNNTAFGGQNFTYRDDRIFQVGQSMGLLLALTYPISGTWSSAVRL